MAVSDRIAVMHQGSVVQVGTATDLYHRPVSEFVATFVGRVNLISGRVTALVGDTASVAALGTIIPAQVVHADLAPGDPVKLVLRPEALEIVPDGEGMLAATIHAGTFLGEKIEYVLRCGDATLQAVRHNAGHGDIILEGTRVALRFAADAVTVLPEGAG